MDESNKRNESSEIKRKKVKQLFDIVLNYSPFF